MMTRFAGYMITIGLIFPLACAERRANLQKTHGCPSKKWLYFMESCYLFEFAPTTRTQAGEICSQYGGQLIDVNDKPEQKYIESILESNLTELNRTHTMAEGYWTGGFRIAQRWRWGNGKEEEPLLQVNDEIVPLTFDDWHPGEPNNPSELAITLKRSHRIWAWNDLWTSSDHRLNTICEKVSNSGCRSPWIQYANSCYLFYTRWPKQTHMQAKRFCRNQRAYLVAINSREENQFLYRQFSNSYTTTAYWTGGVRLGGVGGEFVWEVETYDAISVNFSSYSPKGSEYRYSILTKLNGTWVIYRADGNRPEIFVCEQPMIVSGHNTEHQQLLACPGNYELIHNRCYEFAIDKLTVGEAERQCMLGGGHLMAIDSAEELTYIVQKLEALFIDENIYVGHVKVGDKWIRAEDAGNFLVPTEFLNWDFGQPFQSSLTAPGYLVIDSTNYRWQNLPADKLSMKTMGFICEKDKTKFEIFQIDRACTSDLLGSKYIGVQSTTRRGAVCQRWIHQYPNRHEMNRADRFPDARVTDAANYCRNPDNSPMGPWCYVNSFSVRWDYCGIPRCDVKLTTETTKGIHSDCIHPDDIQGINYNGTMNITADGNSCQSWDSVPAYARKKRTYMKVSDASMANASNYCRNPDKKPEGPWCYLANMSAGVWAYCAVPSCDLAEIEEPTLKLECKYRNDSIALKYTGTKQTTRNGYLCQRWTSQKPNAHIRTLDVMFPDKTVADAGNFCRNPDKSKKPWCYTVNGPRWDYCEIRYCNDDDIATQRKYCKIGFSRYGEKCYHVSSSVTNGWSEANSACSRKGAELVAIKSKGEFFYITKMLESTEGRFSRRTQFWTGGRRKQASLWTWGTSQGNADDDDSGKKTTSPFVFTHWRLGEPNSLLGKVVTYKKINGEWGWDDVHPNKGIHSGFICEKGSYRLGWNGWLFVVGPPHTWKLTYLQLQFSAGKWGWHHGWRNARLPYICENSKIPVFKNGKVTAECPDCILGNHAVFKDTCYCIKRETKAWYYSYMDCQSTGGNLISLDSVNETNAITKHLSKSRAYWTGGLPVDDTWMWSRDYAQFKVNPDQFSSWSPGEPNNSENMESYIAINRDRKGWGWNDERGNVRLRYICETPILPN
ncbi:uncharacterized protein LOC141899442 isoform X2 [Tubulanus polymorphus]|uniref:uncharacterized protein LOC141899442 isoform X2 n=1 Tax=Tubulanus polymorphus TaxID=672921 RepID=UPI003DA3AB08